MRSWRGTRFPKKALRLLFASALSASLCTPAHSLRRAEGASRVPLRQKQYLQISSRWISISDRRSLSRACSINKQKSAADLSKAKVTCFAASDKTRLDCHETTVRRLRRRARRRRSIFIRERMIECLCELWEAHSTSLRTFTVPLHATRMVATERCANDGTYSPPLRQNDPPTKHEFPSFSFHKQK